MEYWKQVDFWYNVFSMQKDIYFHAQALRRELDNQFNKFAVKLLNGEEIVGYLPREYTRVACYFLARGGSISVSGRPYTVDTVNNFCGRMEILLHRSIETVKFLLKSGDLCKFMAWCTEVLTDKPHPRFYTKVLIKKCAAYTLVFTVAWFSLVTPL